jgi:hypothetical protein
VDLVKAFGFSIGKKAMLWGQDVEYLRERGFNVVDEDANIYMPGNLATILGAASGMRILHGIFFWGHGDPNAIYNKKGDLIATYASLVKAIKYKMAFVMLNACFSDHEEGDTNITFWFPNQPLKSQAFPGPLAAGGRDLTWEGGIFKGSKGILSPFQRLPVFKKIEFKFPFTPHSHPSDELDPGDQGTKP